MITFVLSLLLYVGISVAGIAIYRRLDMLLELLPGRWSYLGGTIRSTLILIFIVMALFGLANLESYSSVWLGLLLLNPVLVFLYWSIRWQMYGKRKAEERVDTYYSKRQQQFEAVNFLEGLGFEIEETIEDNYTVHHPDYNVLLRGIVNGHKLVSLARGLETLMLYHQLNNTPVTLASVRFSDVLFSHN